MGTTNCNSCCTWPNSVLQVPVSVSYYPEDENIDLVSARSHGEGSESNYSCITSPVETGTEIM